MPSNFFEDLYNDASGTDVTTRAASGCGAPTLVSGGGTVQTATFNTRQAAFFGDDAIRLLRYPCTPPGSGDYELQAEWEVDGPAGGNWRLEGRIRRGATTWVYFLIHNIGSIDLVENGGVSTTGSHSLGTGTLNSMRVVGSGSTVQLYIGATLAATLSGVSTLGAGDIEIGGRSVYINRVTGVDPAGGAGTPPGIAAETDAALALSGKQIRALGLATETDAALALTGTALAGLPFNTSAYEFGQRTGLDIEDFSLYASTSLNVSVFADADVLLASRLFAYTESTGSDGRLTRKTHASLVAGTTYIFVAVTTGGALVAAGRITAT